MTTSYGSIAPLEQPFAPRTPSIIGRQEYVEAIRRALADTAGQSYFLYFVGSGGIGKTRLLEEVMVFQQSAIPFLSSRIIDLYHADYHSPDGLRQAIVARLDPGNQFFQRYREHYAVLLQKLHEGNVGPELEQLRNEIDSLFLQEYNILAKQHRIALCFDTVELIEYESDTVLEICQIQEEAMGIKNWFEEQVANFPNTVVLLAGRPRPILQADFERAFSGNGRIYHIFDLQALNQHETETYLTALGEQRPDLLDILSSSVQEQVFRITRGRPIYLSILVDLMIHGGVLSQFFPISDAIVEDVDEELIGQHLVEHLLNLPDPFGQMIYFLMHARKGLDADLLRYLVRDVWPAAQMQEIIDRTRTFTFVKTRPETTQLFLHDEVYALFDHYFRDDPRFGHEYEPIAQYYRQQSNLDAAMQTSEQQMISQLYYELQIDVFNAYNHYYVRWDEEAIKSHENEFDMRLRDEVLRFLDRYTKPDSPFYDPRIADRIDRGAVDRDSAVRWVKRYLARTEFQKAVQVASNLRSSRHASFDWDEIDASLYKADLLTAWSEAMLYIGSSEIETLRVLNEAIDLLQEQPETEANRYRRRRILGRAYNNIGYSHWTRGHFGKAWKEYRQALAYFKNVEMFDEQADTLNNLAFLLALLGRINLALRHIDQALKIREHMDRAYPIALSRNTRGRIYTLREHPMWGEQECRAALSICESIQQPRGIGLACNGLGFALRKRGEQWKLGVYTHAEAEHFFQEGVNYLQRARKTFSGQIPEPIRLWEANNELGSLYCDWGWLSQKRNEGQLAKAEQVLDQYAQSIRYQQEALHTAKSHNLQFQIAESLDDLAQVHGDRGFLLEDIGRQDEAKEDNKIANAYLEEVVRDLIPEEFRLSKGKGFSDAPEAGECYWLFLGKAHLQYGIWTFRQIERMKPNESQLREQWIEGIRYFSFAAAYFQRYWPQSFALNSTIRAFASRLEEASVPSELALSVIQDVSRTYVVDLGLLLEAVGDIIDI